MDKTIGNPFSWFAQRLGAAGAHASATVGQLGGEATAREPTIRRITRADLMDALRRGAEDAAAFRADVVFVILLYPVLGVLLFALTLQGELLHILFPLASGFALLGPVAAVGLYEMSRRRERGEDTDWFSAFAVIRSPSFGAIFLLGLYLAAIFVVWLLTANLIYQETLGPEPPTALAPFLAAVFTTGAGWTMIGLGVAVGCVFAAVVLAISVVSFPMLLDRRVGVPRAVATSMKVTRENPRTVATWGLIVALGLVLGSLPFFVGLILVLPVLGHATWHLYRRAVRWD